MKNERQEKRKQLGLCANCSNEAEKGKTTCVECQKRSFNRKKLKLDSLKSQGICIKCSVNPQQKGFRCIDCVEKGRNTNKIRENKYVDSGKCFRCGWRDLIGVSKFCLECYLKDISRRIWRTTQKWKVLLDLFHKQDGLCVYLKSPIQLGVNASIDHKIAKSKGGSNEIENLQWVHFNVNMMKWDLNQEDFLKLVMRIAENINEFTVAGGGLAGAKTRFPQTKDWSSEW